MSEQFTSGIQLPATNEPLRIAVRRLRWFRAAFNRYVVAIGQQLGCSFDIDETKIAAIFVRWLDAIDRQRPSNKAERAAFFQFAASLMFRELVADMPIRAKAAPKLAQPDSPGAFWPEGYACTMFCLSVHASAMEQEFHARTLVSADIDNLRTWWSFRENAAEDATFAAGFLQKMLGHDPNWGMPSSFGSRIGDWLDPDYGQT